MRTGLRNHRRHQRTERGIASATAGRFAADVLEGLQDKEQTMTTGTVTDLRTALADLVLKLEESAADARVNEERYAGETGGYVSRGRARAWEETAEDLAWLLKTEGATNGA